MVINTFIKSLLTRRYSTFAHRPPLQIEHLTNRSLIKVSGDEVHSFLQGLITNDITSLSENGKALFTFFLNNKGRVLFDSLLYRKTDTEILLECDASTRDTLINHLKVFRVRKKIGIEPVDDNVCVVFAELDAPSTPNTNLREADKFFVCNAPFVERENSTYEMLQNSNLEQTTFGDPRMNALGARVYGSVSQTISRLYEVGVGVRETVGYTKFRYTLGVAEGIAELPPGSCFPLEANCDYLHGVSFHKGCYLGQELTARTFHTGVIRKRLMPLILSSVPVQKPPQDAIIETEDGKKVGKLRGIAGKHAIALLRITESLQNATKLKLLDVSASTYKPFWWPHEEQSENYAPQDTSA